MIESDTCRCARWAAAREVIRGKRRNFADDEVFFGAGGFAGGNAFGNQESVGGDTQCRVMMKASSPPPFIATQPQCLFHVLVIPLDAPAHVRLGHQVVQRDAVRLRRQVVFERIDVARKPFDQQPLLGVEARLANVSPTRCTRTAAKRPLSISLVSRRKLMVWKALARQRMREVLDRYRCSDCPNAQAHLPNVSCIPQIIARITPPKAAEHLHRNRARGDRGLPGEALAGPQQDPLTRSACPPRRGGNDSET